MSSLRLTVRSNDVTPDMIERFLRYGGKVHKGETKVARGAYRALRGGVPVDDSDGGMRSHLGYNQYGVRLQRASVVWSRDASPRLIKA